MKTNVQLVDTNTKKQMEVAVVVVRNNNNRTPSSIKSALTKKGGFLYSLMTKNLFSKNPFFEKFNQ